MFGWFERRRARKLLLCWEAHRVQIEREWHQELEKRWECDRPQDHMPYDKD